MSDDDPGGSTGEDAPARSRMGRLIRSPWTLTVWALGLTWAITVWAYKWVGRPLRIVTGLE